MSLLPLLISSVILQRYIQRIFTCYRFKKCFVSQYDETSMSESLRAIDKTASENKDIKAKLRKFESIFDRSEFHPLQIF